MFRVNNKNIRTTSSVVFIVNFGHIPHLFLIIKQLSATTFKPEGTLE